MQPCLKHLVVRPARDEVAEDLRIAPCLFDCLDLGQPILGARRPGVVVASDLGGIAPRQDQRVTSLRVGSGEEHAHRTTLRVPEQHGPLGADSVHDRTQVVHADLEGGEVLQWHRVGKAGPSLVERDQPREGSEPVEEARQARVFPHHLDVGDPSRHVDEIALPRAHHLVGDVDLATLGVTRRHHRSISPEKRRGLF